MASSFKTFDPKDVVSTRNLLHEAVPITGTIISGTYGTANIKNYAHGMFQSVYDYPYLSSSANHIFDITAGYSTAAGGLSSSTNTQNAKKVNIYNQMAQVLAGYDQNGVVRQFDADGDLTGGDKISSALFMNFARLLTKDEVKKGSFSLDLGVASSYIYPMSSSITLTDYSGSSGFKVNSPAGEYGILYATGSALLTGTVDQRGYTKAGLIYYQAGVVVLTSSIFNELLDVASSGSCCGSGGGRMPTISGLLTGSAITASCDMLRHRIINVQFNNTTELNSSIYFCRVNHNDFNYSANLTYLSASKMVVKNNSTDSPVSYTTAVGLYSADNELLAVAKLSEPLRKDPSTEFTLRVRLDY